MLHLVAGLVFFLLSPGVLLTIPAGSRGLFASGQTSVLAAAVHAVVFVVVAYLLTGLVTVEGFGGSCTAPHKGCSVAGTSCDSSVDEGGRRGCGTCQRTGNGQSLYCDLIYTGSKRSGGSNKTFKRKPWDQADINNMLRLAEFN